MSIWSGVSCWLAVSILTSGYEDLNLKSEIARKCRHFDRFNGGMENVTAGLCRFITFCRFV